MHAGRPGGWAPWICRVACMRSEGVVQAAALLEGGQERLQEFVESLEYSPAAYAAAKQRLHGINELLEDCGCGTTAELLEVAADTRSALARWEEVAGAAPPPPACMRVRGVTASCTRRQRVFRAPAAAASVL